MRLAATRALRAAALLAVALPLSAGCKARRSPGAPAGDGAAGAVTAPAPPLTPAEFNRLAVRLNLPVFWRGDANGNGAADSDELARLLFYPSSDRVEVVRAREAILAARDSGPQPGLMPEAARRRALVVDDLDQGAPVLLATDLRAASPGDRKLADHMLAAARKIDELYAAMKGARALAERVPIDDAASQSLFRRNWGPACAMPRTRGNPECSAIPGAPRPTNDAYPAAMQADPDFCARLAERPDAAALSDHFSVVRERKGGGLASVPYPAEYGEPMRALAAELHAAAGDVTDPAEAALKAYLGAAAQGFLTNDWGPADEAWSRMNAHDSRWYVRVAPDEVLGDPCKLKAQFHLTFARVDSGSLEWQGKLDGLQADMEKAIAALAGPPYAPRAVAFHLPDFIDVVFVAGDDRQPVGATAGESLPNWGKVASEGRGRTVAMVNLGLDPVSVSVRRAQVESLFDGASARAWSDDPRGALLGTVLHEATHNLGPTAVYSVQGKTPEAAFGGELASMLEELKAETGAMFYVDWLRRRGLVSPEQQQQAYGAWLGWCMRHVAGGVRSGTGDQAYAQLAAIQVGLMLDDGALAWDPSARTAGGGDVGAFTVHYDKLPAAFEKMLRTVATLKARGDRPAAEALVARYVDGSVVPLAVIGERVLRFPESTVVYSVDR